MPPASLPRLASLTLTAGLGLTSCFAVVACGSGDAGPDAQLADPIDGAVGNPPDGAVGNPPDGGRIEPPDGGSVEPPDGGNVEPPDAAPPPPVDPVNIATLEGPPVDEMGPLLRRTLPVDVIVSDPDIEVTAAYATNTGELGADPRYSWYFYDITNIGSTDRCNVGFTEITLVDSSGTALAPPRAGYALATARRTLEADGTLRLRSCLLPGQHAWVVDTHMDADFDAISRVEVKVTADDVETTLPAAHLLPTAYDFNSGFFHIDVENTGTATAYGISGTWISLDEDNLPLEFGDVYPYQGAGDVAAGDTGLLRSFPLFWGTVAHLVVVTSFYEITP